MQTITPNQIHRIKQKAKKIAKTTNQSHLMVLDREARTRGFSNWESLQSYQSSPLLFPIFQRTTEEMQAQFKKARKTSGLYVHRIEEKEVRKDIAPLHDKFANALSALIYARDFMQCILQVKRFSINRLSTVYSEMRVLLPYVLQFVTESQYVIVGRDYTPVGMTEDKWVNYADFPKLQITLDEKAFSQLRNSAYLYSDGNAPWNSKKDAEAYLHRLNRLIELVSN